MCGITGFLATGQRRSQRALNSIARDMIGALEHRGPDAGDLWFEEALPVYLGHRRLSILDLSAEGAQPMVSPSGRYVVVYNGEIYNYLNLAPDLEASGFRFRGHSDTEVFLAAVEAYGLNSTLQKISGMFAFALWDRQEHVLYCAVDRFGKKPLYIGWAGKTLVFGSELKALVSHPDFENRIDKDVAASYFGLGSVPAPASIYKGVWRMPAGHRVSIPFEMLAPGSDLSVLMEPYWDASDARQTARLSAFSRSGNTVQDFDDVLTASVKERLISDVPLGAFLSGGIDSSLVVAKMQKLSVQKVKTFTIGFDDPAYDESPYAENMANYLGTEHHSMTCTADDVLSLIPKLSSVYDEPFSDMSALSMLLVSRFARKHVTVALSGDGGDELLGGYTRHAMAPKLWNRMALMPLFMRKLVAKRLAGISEIWWDQRFPNKPQFGRHAHKAISLLDARNREDVYMRLLGVWKDAPVKGGNAHDLQPIDVDKRMKFAEWMMLADTYGYLPNTVLTKVDRASMAYGLEARAPFLDRNIYNFVWGLPLSMKIKKGQGKWLLREVLKNYVPEDLFERPKQGFNLPIGEWLRGPLKGWAEGLLNADLIREQGILDEAVITQTWQKHLHGEGHQTEKLWTALMFQAWLLEHWQ